MRSFHMKKISADTFEAKGLALLEEVQSKRETILITKRGKPIAKLVPVVSHRDEIYGFLAGKGTVLGDIVSLK